MDYIIIGRIDQTRSGVFLVDGQLDMFGEAMEAG